MKKKTLLSLLTGVAIIASTAGTYAAWDKISDATNGGEVTFNHPVNVTAAQNISIDNSNDVLADSNDASAPTATVNNVSFTVDDEDHKADTLTITPQVKDGEQDVTNKFQIVTTRNTDETITQLTDPKTTSTSNGVLTESITTGVNNIKPTYTVTIQPIDSSEVGKSLNVTLKAELSKSTATTQH
ncbi:MAG TPA: hypothetical protein DG753_11490 [Clostridium sp.]|nr:hypothetical protein [Clostridium sp.]